MKRKNKNKLPPFVALTWDMLNSNAYKELPSSAAKLLPYFLGKVKLTYNDPARLETTFTFTYSEAKKYFCGKTTFYNTIKALMRNGFIDPVKKGGLRSYGNTPSIFKLSKRWGPYGKSSFVEVKWECFHTKLPSQVPKVNYIKPETEQKNAIAA